jgi:hypothetical protein
VTEEDTTQFLVTGFRAGDLFRQDSLLLHKRVIRALWGIDESAEEAYRRLRPYHGQAKNLSRNDVALIAARCALAVRDLVDDEGWGGTVWPLLQRVARYTSLTSAEWKALDHATTGLDKGGHAHYAVRGAARRWLSTADGAAIALRYHPDKTRYLDLLVELAELTSR